MSKLLLTSTGLSSSALRAKFKSLFTKPLGEIKMVFIPTAARSKEELGYVKGSKCELIDLGVKEKNILVYNCDSTTKLETLKMPDCIYVCGGNTFYLLHYLKASKADQLIINWINQGTVYVGVSAGSIVAGPDITVAGPWDPNDIKLNDLSGLKLTELIVSPHYVEAEAATIRKIEKKINHNIVRLKDNQGIFIDSDII